MNDERSARMNTNRDNPETIDPALDEHLRWQLRGLRRDAVPTTDLWPGIEARIRREARHARGAASLDESRVVPIRRGPARFAPWALAASLVLVVGVAWQQRPDFGQDAPAPIAQLIPREAEAMTREYDAALRELQASGVAPVTDEAALRELDRSAAQIRTALTRDPQARFLLDRLRSTYEKRLELTQRATLS
jgi:hypothetical protein